MSIAFFRTSRQLLLPALVSFALAACSGPVSPPMGIDDDTMVSSIPPDNSRDDTTAYAAPVDPIDRTEKQRPAGNCKQPKIVFHRIHRVFL